MWFTIEGRIGSHYFSRYFQFPHIWSKLKYRFSKKYRASMDEIPF